MFEEVCLYRPSADAKSIPTSSPARGSKGDYDDRSDADGKDHKSHK